MESRYRLRSMIGIMLLIGIGFIFSKHPYSVKLQPVVCGFILQFIFAFVCIRWSIGRQIFQCIGDKLANFLNFSKFGAEFVYGDFLVHKESVFAFSVSRKIYYIYKNILMKEARISYHLKKIEQLVSKRISGNLNKTVQPSTIDN